MSFSNILSDVHRDELIMQELKGAGIFAADRPKESIKVVGELTTGGQVTFTFTRHWRYYEVVGNVPLDTAEQLYQHPLADDIRVFGVSGGTEPKEYAYPTGAAVQAYMEAQGLDRLGEDVVLQLADEGKIAGPRYIWRYHIDSLEALAAFVAQLREDGVVD